MSLIGFLDAFVRLLPTLGFATLAIIILVSAWLVGQVRRITHAAFFMILAFTGVAGIYVMLGADFLAGSQVLIYVGAVAIMFLFAIMVSDLKELSDRPTGREPATDTVPPGVPALGETGPSRRPWVGPAALVAAGFAALVLVALAWSGVPTATFPAASGPATTAPIGRALFTTFLVPFEVASIVLLVALVGAIVIAAREDERGGEARGTAGTGEAGGRAESAEATEGGGASGRKGEAA